MYRTTSRPNSDTDKKKFLWNKIDLPCIVSYGGSSMRHSIINGDSDVVLRKL